MIPDDKTRPPERAGPSKTSAGRIASLSEAALDLAANGWAVFPCKWWGEDAKRPLTTDGHHDASRHPDQIKAWWRHWPKAMIGAPVPATLLAVDIDPRKGGSLAALEAITGPLPTTLTVWSGRNDGGQHLYFLRPHGPLTSTRLPKGIDLKANGYCIVPPSIHPVTGQPYRWQQHPVAPAPHSLRELLLPAPRPVKTFTGCNSSGAGLVRKVAETAEGDRNRVLFWAACRAAEDGLLDALENELANAAVSAGLPERGVRANIGSARRRYS
jgi:hypothetical protein